MSAGGAAHDASARAHGGLSRIYRCALDPRELTEALIGPERPALSTDRCGKGPRCAAGGCGARAPRKGARPPRGSVRGRLRTELMATIYDGHEGRDVAPPGVVLDIRTEAHFTRRLARLDGVQLLVLQRHV